MTTIEERNRQILQMRMEGVSQPEVARRFKLSRSRIYLIERKDCADKSMAVRRDKLREEIRAADDPGKLWPVNDLVDAIGLVGVAKKRLLGHFEGTGKAQISLLELMDMCLCSPVKGPVEGSDFTMAPLLRVYGIGKKGFWSVVNGLTNMDLGKRCNQEWRERLAKVKQESGISGATPYSSEGR